MSSEKILILKSDIFDDRYVKITERNIQSVVIQSGDYTLENTDQVVVFSATATATLPQATGSGRTYRICNEGTGIVTIDGNGTETIKGETTQIIYGGDDLIVTDYATGKWA